MLSNGVLSVGSLDFGNLTMKSKAILAYDSSVTLGVYSSLYGLCLACFVLAHVSHSYMYLSTSFHSPSHVKSLMMSSIVLAILRWPIDFTSCLTSMMLFLFSISTSISIIASTAID